MNLQYSWKKKVISEGTFVAIIVCSLQQLKIDCFEYPPTFSNAMEEYGLYCWGFQEL